MKRGWCPSLFEPMQAKDGLLLRVKPFAGQLFCSAAMLLAEAATRFGNGMIQLTNRANLQFRGFTAESAVQFAHVVTGLGLASTDRDAERRRNVVVSPLAGHGCGVHAATLEIAGALETMLVGEQDFAVLPGKFGIVVDGGGPCPMRGVPGDIIVQLRDGIAAVSLGGEAFWRVAEGDLVESVTAIIRGFIEQGPHARMRDADQARVLHAAGLSEAVVMAPDIAPPPIGDVGAGFGIGVTFGQLDAAGLRALALLAADSPLFLTPWRSVMLSRSPSGPVDASFITDPNDARLLISACIGQQGCEQASVRTLDDAAILARSGRLGLGPVHVSGCSKGCAHRGPAALTLVGENGRYNVVRNGRAGEAPVMRGLSLAELLALPALEEIV